METLDVIEKMQEYDEADLWWGRDPEESGTEWTFYALNNLGELDINDLDEFDFEDWEGNGATPVEAYKDALERDK